MAHYHDIVYDKIPLAVSGSTAATDTVPGLIRPSTPNTRWGIEFVIGREKRGDP